MKSILILLSLSLSSLSFAQQAKNFLISGNILNATDCSYDLFEVSNEGTWNSIEQGNLGSTYELSLPSEGLYLMVFKNNDDIKHMYLDLSNESVEYMNVNFDYNSHIIYYYDVDEQKYITYQVGDSTIIEMYKSQ